MIRFAPEVKPVWTALRSYDRQWFHPVVWLCGGIGRRARLKIWYSQGCESSILSGATIHLFKLLARFDNFRAEVAVLRFFNLPFLT